MTSTAVKTKLLICDDEEGTREAMRLILGSHFDLILAASGAQCLDCLARAKDIGLVLLDIKMPQLSGMDVLKEVRQKFPKIKIGMITGYNSVEIAGECARLGVIGYITKPFNRTETLESVKRMAGA